MSPVLSRQGMFDHTPNYCATGLENGDTPETNDGRDLKKLPTFIYSVSVYVCLYICVYLHMITQYPYIHMYR